MVEKALSIVLVVDWIRGLVVCTDPVVLGSFPSPFQLSYNPVRCSQNAID